MIKLQVRPSLINFSRSCKSLKLPCGSSFCQNLLDLNPSRGKLMLDLRSSEETRRSLLFFPHS
ncbi:unnamed protein product [Musa hybrid cultivar]